MFPQRDFKLLCDEFAKLTPPAGFEELSTLPQFAYKVPSFPKWLAATTEPSTSAPYPSAPSTSTAPMGGYWVGPPSVNATLSMHAAQTNAFMTPPMDPFSIPPMNPIYVPTIDPFSNPTSTDPFSNLPMNPTYPMPPMNPFSMGTAPTNAFSVGTNSMEATSTTAAPGPAAMGAAYMGASSNMGAPPMNAPSTSGASTSSFFQYF